MSQQIDDEIVAIKGKIKLMIGEMQNQFEKKYLKDFTEGNTPPPNFGLISEYANRLNDYTTELETLQQMKKYL